MDMNDKKNSPAFQAFQNSGFVDLFNTQLLNPITYAHPDNNMVRDGEKPATLDYIMIKEKRKGTVSIKRMGMESLKTEKGINFSDHEALFAALEIFV